MIEVHHLAASRSRRITWALEELGQTYEVINYARDPTTNLAPPELKAIHPLGKAPVLRDGAVTLIESGAIIDYLIRTYGQGRLQPSVTSPDYNRYVQMLHYAEGYLLAHVLMTAQRPPLAGLIGRFLAKLADTQDYEAAYAAEVGPHLAAIDRAWLALIRGVR